MSDKLGQSPAFPVMPKDDQEEEMIDKGLLKHGISKRLYLAAMAMQGLLANQNTGAQIVSEYGSVDAKKATKIVCCTALMFADELLRQEDL